MKIEDLKILDTYLKEQTLAEGTDIKKVADKIDLLVQDYDIQARLREM